MLHLGVMRFGGGSMLRHVGRRDLREHAGRNRRRAGGRGGRLAFWGFVGSGISRGVRERE